MICDRCLVICDSQCPKCKSSRHLRLAQPDEPVLLIILTAMQAMLVEPVLQQIGVPYYKKGMAGGALAAQVGMMREVYRFYVPHSAMDACRSMIESVFGEDETIMNLLHEFDTKREEKGE